MSCNIFLHIRGRDRPSNIAVLDLSYTEERVGEQQAGQERKEEDEEDPRDLEFYDEAHLAVAVCDTAIGIVVKKLDFCSEET